MQEGGPPILAGVTGPKGRPRPRDGRMVSIRGQGMVSPMRLEFSSIGSTPMGGGRSRYRAERVGGFWSRWHRTPMRSSRTTVHKYIKVIGEVPARWMASMVDRSSPDAVRVSLDAYEVLGVRGQCWLNTVIVRAAEIDVLLEVMDKRG